MKITTATAGSALQEIRQNSKSQKEKGLAFERLTAALLESLPEYGFQKIWSYSDWPEREQSLGLAGTDLGIDLVGQRKDRTLCAIQCKCHDPKYKVSRKDITNFLVESAKKSFQSRILVATSPWNENAEKALHGQWVPVQRIDFDSDLAPVPISWDGTRPKIKPETRKILPLQQEALDKAKNHFSVEDRGVLQMACGTGKTFVSLKIMENLLSNPKMPQRVLFCAPSLALVSQAHREWLRFRDPAKDMNTLIVCSDRSAGKAGANDISPLELTCPPTTDPEALMQAQQSLPKNIRLAVFCTYQSLPVIQKAQKDFGFPKFGIVICDEAHRTAGRINQDDAGNNLFTDFQLIHDGNAIRSHKRLYMTATPRIYNLGTKNHFQRQAEKAASNAWLLDMQEDEIYGQKFHTLGFPKAVEAGMLSDFKVIVLCMDKHDSRLDQSGLIGADGRVLSDIGKTAGTLMAVTGHAIDEMEKSPDPMKRVVAFAKDIARSKKFQRDLEGPDIRNGFPQIIQNVITDHVDGTHTSLDRNRKLRALRDTDTDTHILCNAKLLTEGIDVPALDAVIFLDARQSQVDVVQATGRVMRRAPGKKYGYVVIPVVVPMQIENPEKYLEFNHEGFKVVWQVLSAMRSHDDHFLQEIENDFHPGATTGNQTGKSRLQIWNLSSQNEAVSENNPMLPLQVRKFTDQVYAKILKQVGTQNYQASTAGQMDQCIQSCAALLKRHNLGKILVPVLGTEDDSSTKNDRTAKIACLMLLNACLMQARLEKHMLDLKTLDRIRVSRNIATGLVSAWKTILKQDFRPVYVLPLDILKVLDSSAQEPETRKDLHKALKRLIICAQENADNFAKLGFDHAGPLYHKLLPGAESDGAFYTNNVSAVLLAGLALDKNFCNWKDRKAISRLKIIDPAMGTGTLLMAAARQIKKNHAEAMNDPSREQNAKLHQSLVENVICGLDINPHGVQMGALNLTLGAPTVDYRKMNLFTMPHGPQPDGTMKAGSLELLDDRSDWNDLFRAAEGKFGDLELEETGAKQVDQETDLKGRFQSGTADLVIMNPPFTDNVKKGRKFSRDIRRQMQHREEQIAKTIENKHPEDNKLTNSNSLGTYFNPLADNLLKESGTFAFLNPTIAAIGEIGTSTRKFLARRYQIEIIVTSHDPKKVNFVENSNIHESLFVLRKTEKGTTKSTKFVSLRKMPENAAEAEQIVKDLNEYENSSTPPPPPHGERSTNCLPSRYAMGIGQPSSGIIQKFPEL